ncbi:MAG TPA: hypothetical protein VJO34_04910 [Methylomirabilota bacterium]|nr:hypothetical protein [Methylomirabilota bacterium]
MTIKPGNSTTLSLAFTMHAGMGGAHEFLVPLRTNDPITPERQLIVRSNWGP